ncbi:MAG: CheF family chemotaxis protein [Salinirussus sp.]
MSEGERKLVDTPGDYLYAVRDGAPVDEPRWRTCRVVLTDERLVLATSDGKRGIPHDRIRVTGDDAVPDGVDASGATPLEIGDNLILIDAETVDDFEPEYCRAALHDEVILVKRRAVVGGVVQDDAEWSKARFRLDDDRVVLGLAGGDRAGFRIDDVGTIGSTTASVAGEQRRVVRVEHTDDEGRSVETHFSGAEWHSEALASLLNRVIERRSEEYELSELESQVLMALYSGVSPFEMSDFVGIDVEEVEEIYHTLLDVGAVDKVRERTEVTLNAQGRNMASEAMSER